MLLYSFYACSVALEELADDALVTTGGADVGVDFFCAGDEVWEDGRQSVDVACFICVEDILSSLDAGARSVPGFGTDIFGADEEVECVFDVGVAFLWKGVSGLGCRTIERLGPTNYSE